MTWDYKINFLYDNQNNVSRVATYLRADFMELLFAETYKIA